MDKEKTALEHSLIHIKENAAHLEYQMKMIQDRVHEVLSDDHDKYMIDGKGLHPDELRNMQDKLTDCIGASVMHSLRNINGAAPVHFIDQKRSFFLMEQTFDLEGANVPAKWERDVSDYEDEGLTTFRTYMDSGKFNQRRVGRRRHNS